MLLKPSSLFDKISGKLNSLVIAHRAAYTCAGPIGRRDISLSQYLGYQKYLYGLVTDLWRNEPLSVKNHYASIASSYVIYNRFGDPMVLMGFNCIYRKISEIGP
jgi:hypothetical protein